MKLTEFKFFRNTPFTDFSNTVIFKSNEERNDYFNSHFSSISFSQRFNFIRDRSIIRVSLDMSELIGVNYCTFKSDFEDIQYYAYVIETKYINDMTVEISLLIDGIMTFCQGDVLSNLKNLTVERKHLSNSEYNEKLPELRNNNDVLKTVTKKYTGQNYIKFKNLSVLIQISCDLTSDFGDVDNPKIVTSEGLTFDKISSPLNLYVCTQDNFKILMKKLQKYAWITQNIRSVSLIPSVLIENKTEKVIMKSIEFDELYTLKNNGNTFNTSLEESIKEISMTETELCNMFGIDQNQELHLLRNEYTTTEMYNFTGGQLLIDNGLLSRKYGLELKCKTVIGYHNEVKIYVENYRSVTDVEGSFLNDSIAFDTFDDVPIMIDNYNLSLSKSANQRQLAESKLLGGKVDNIVNGTDTKQRFLDGASLISNLNPTNLFGKFVEENEFYRQQQAEFKDLALETNAVTSQSNNNSLAIANDFFGLTIKFSQPSTNEWKKIKRYYKSFGYLVNEENSTVNAFNMTVCDYLKFSGSYQIPKAYYAINEMIKAQFSNGVRLWHNDNTDNPMLQDTLNNVRK